MNTRFAKNGFAAVRDFISPELADIAHKYAMLRSKLGLGKKLEGKKARCGERQQYGDHLMETILDQSTSKMEMIVGRELWPSYSFYRLYTKGMFFPRHRDRPSCEFSVSLCLGRDFSNLSAGDAKADWPLFANGVPVPCPPGGGIVYRGCEVEHWREPLKGNHQLQLFLHYVDKNGPFGKLCRFDSRPMLGTPSNLRDPKKLKRLEETTDRVL